MLAQYRSFLRTARRLPGGERKEIEELVKYDFRWDNYWIEKQSQSDKHSIILVFSRANASYPASDEEQVKALLQHGERMLKELKQSVDLATAS